MSKSDPDAFFEPAPGQTAPVPPFGLGLLLSMSDGVALALTGWAWSLPLLSAAGPATDDLVRRALVTGLMLVPLVKSVFGVYSLGRIDHLERSRRTLRGAIACTAVLAVPYVVLDHMGVFFPLALAFALSGFLATFVADLLVVHGVVAAFPQWRTPVVIIGAGDQGALIAEKLQRLPWLGMRPVCFFDDDPQRWQGRTADLPVVGPVSLLTSSPAYAGLARAAIITDSGGAGPRLAELVRTLPFRQIYCVLGECAMNGIAASCHDLHGSLALRVGVRPQAGYLALRRAVDVVVAALLLILLAPLMLLIALAIRIDSPGPALFRQTRWAGGTGTFGCLKFRSMHRDAEAHLHRILERDPALREEYARFHKLRVDPRITRIGRLLRRTSLDELPQLWNVLVGEMSLIGPRAYMPKELPEIGDAAPVIGGVRPGVTGYWQVSGRHRTTFQQRVAMDVFYVRNRGFLFDLHILVKTAVVLLKADGS